MLPDRKKYSPSPRLILLIGLILVLSSFISLTHASQHLFHQFDQGCEVFLSIEKNSAVDSPVTGIDIGPYLCRHVSVAGHQLQIQSARMVFSSRAPPSF
jgi:hypothetical protein